MKKDFPAKRLLHATELARFLGVTIGWVESHSAPSARRRLPVCRVGKFNRYDLDEILAWLDQKEADNVD